MTLHLREAAYTVQAIIDAGIPVSVARTLIADGPRAVPERAFESVTGRRRTPDPVHVYVWGPDAMTLLGSSVAAEPIQPAPAGEETDMARTHIEIGLATWEALKAYYEVSREMLKDETDPREIALMQARLGFIDSAKLNKWKARIPMPTDAKVKALLAEDLAHLGTTPAPIPEFEPDDKRRELVRMALWNMAKKLGWTQSYDARMKEVQRGLKAAKEAK